RHRAAASSLSLLLSTLRPPPSSTLFPYTTLFRSHLVDTHAVLASNRAARCNTRLHDLGARRLDLVLENRIGRVERNVGMEIAVARVEDVAHDQAVMCGDRCNRFEDLRQDGARHDGILYDEGAGQA